MAFFFFASAFLPCALSYVRFLFFGELHWVLSLLAKVIISVTKYNLYFSPVSAQLS